MMRHKRLEHRFVRHIPERLEPAVLYVSMEYATSAHSCCCGCGEEVVAPFTPTDWKMTFDGETVSLRPSIGNWMLKLIEAGPWTEEQVAAERRRDRNAKARFYGKQPVAELADEPVHTPLAPRSVLHRLWQRITSWR
jgi:hypothetical protein